jgi:hypothetical protein
MAGARVARRSAGRALQFTLPVDHALPSQHAGTDVDKMRRSDKRRSSSAPFASTASRVRDNRDTPLQWDETAAIWK